MTSADVKESRRLCREMFPEAAPYPFSCKPPSRFHVYSPGHAAAYGTEVYILFLNKIVYTKAELDCAKS